MATNKVVFGDTVIMDISDTTAEAQDVAAGKVFYGADGVKRTGTGNYMDKVSNPTADDILVTDANGQAIDSGVKISDIQGVNFEVGAEKWYGTYKDGNTTYQVYSKVVYIPALPNTPGITNYPHGVTNIKQVLAMYGICTNGMIMNTPRQNNQDNIGIYQVQKSGGNFAIEVGKDRSSIGAYVTIIYAKNN